MPTTLLVRELESLGYTVYVVTETVVATENHIVVTKEKDPVKPLLDGVFSCFVQNTFVKAGKSSFEFREIRDNERDDLSFLRAIREIASTEGLLEESPIEKVVKKRGRPKKV